MGLINKTAQIGGKTCHYTVNPITPEMLGTVEKEQPAEAPQRATAERENHTAEAVEAPEVADIVPITAAAGEQPTDLIRLYTSKVETADQTDPQPGETAPVVVPFPRGEIKEPSRDWDLDPAF
ncbi:hypothetical protein NMY27_17065 [Cronobacter dublinensis subsp. beijingensis]|uniref:hypothetical protein n=1 Tax=Cronobacter dublinensis TaxID=413497 RepID=UPI0023DB4058|nr:hypothetical protein [Cronobacter dublinensis]WEP48886.1 hypothetical protein NMY27_17065 [Cronobacter dublinensis]